MGRPSKAKLLEVTLKLQQNLCANCSVPLQSNNAKETKISANSQLRKNKTDVDNKICKEIQDVDNMTLSEAVLTVFEAALKINKIKILRSDTVLHMCKNCACSLSELFWAYKEFLDITNQESYIRAVVKNCLLWNKEKNSRKLEPTLNVSPNTNSKNKNPNTENSVNPEEAEKNDTLVKDRESSIGFLNDISESESENFNDDPNDEDYLPEVKCAPLEPCISIAPERVRKTERRKQATPKRRKTDVESTVSTSPKKTIKENRKQRVAILHKRNLRKTTRSTGQIRKHEMKRKKVFTQRNSVSKIKKKPMKRIVREINLCSCGKKFKSSKLLKIHSIKCKKIVKNSVCRYCGKKFTLKLLRDRHENILHSKELSRSGEPLACRECGKTFKNLTFLRRHASVHSTAKPFQCDTCLKSFKRFDTLQEHQRGKAHALSLGPKSRPYTGGTTTYSCKVCSQVFKHKVSLFRHESKLHAEERPFGCEKCWKRYRNEDKLVHHMKTAHENRKEKERVIYNCELCDKTYTYLYSYKAHVVTHVIAKPFLCSQCGTSFRQKQGFLRHMSTMHKPETRHTCNVCGKSFKRKDHLTQHMRGKTHGKPLKDTKSKQLTISPLKSPPPPKKITEIFSTIISHTSKSKTVPTLSATTTNSDLPTSPQLINVRPPTGHRTTTIIIEAPTSVSHPSSSNNFSQVNVFRPGVIVPSGPSNETHSSNNLQSNEIANNPLPAIQPPSFTFSASNLFFDF